MSHQPRNNSRNNRTARTARNEQNQNSTHVSTDSGTNPETEENLQNTWTDPPSVFSFNASNPNGAYEESEESRDQNLTGTFRNYQPQDFSNNWFNQRNQEDSGNENFLHTSLPLPTVGHESDSLEDYTGTQQGYHTYDTTQTRSPNQNNPTQIDNLRFPNLDRAASVPARRSEEFQGTYVESVPRASPMTDQMGDYYLNEETSQNFIPIGQRFQQAPENRPQPSQAARGVSIEVVEDSDYDGYDSDLGYPVGVGLGEPTVNTRPSRPSLVVQSRRTPRPQRMRDPRPLHTIGRTTSPSHICLDNPELTPIPRRTLLDAIEIDYRGSSLRSDLQHFLFQNPQAPATHSGGAASTRPSRHANTNAQETDLEGIEPVVGSMERRGVPPARFATMQGNVAAYGTDIPVGMASAQPRGFVGPVLPDGGVSGLLQAGSGGGIGMPPMSPIDHPSLQHPLYSLPDDEFNPEYDEAQDFRPLTAQQGPEMLQSSLVDPPIIPFNLTTSSWAIIPRDLLTKTVRAFTSTKKVPWKGSHLTDVSIATESSFVLLFFVRFTWNVMIIIYDLDMLF